MKQPRDSSFTDRRKSSAEAKLALLKKFKNAPKHDDPEMVAKRAERAAISAAREERRAEKERLKHEKLERERAEAEAVRQAELKAQEEREAAARAEAEERAASQRRLAERVIADEAVRKAKRDAKYAARKARQR